MRVNYRGHHISIVEGIDITAHLTDLRTSAALPTKVSATLEEGPTVLLKRAKELIDLYLTPSTAQLSASDPMHPDVRSG
jgi:hypothetical protein